MRALFTAMEFVEEGQNRISALPDCLLLEILSRLPSTKEAIRTGTLSKQWKHVWTSVPTLSFTSADDRDLSTQCRRNFDPRSNFLSFVNKTLTQCRQLKLKKFEACSNYDVAFEAEINKWMRYAISRDVEELYLRFWYFDFKASIRLDQIVYASSCFTDLSLEGCILNPTGAISWKNLRSLSIYNGKLNEDLIENILSGSPLLENLVLHRCYGYRLLDITSKSVKKIELSMDHDSLFREDSVKINAPNILSLTIQGELVLEKVLLVNVSSLVEANLDYDYIMVGYYETSKATEEEMLEGFIMTLRHVIDLKIGSSCSEAVSRLEAKGFVFPSNITLPDIITYDWSGSDGDSDSIEIGGQML